MAVCGELTRDKLIISEAQTRDKLIISEAQDVTYKLSTVKTSFRLVNHSLRGSVTVQTFYSKDKL